MLKRKFMVDISDELLQQNVGINDVKSYIRQKPNEDSFFDELVENSESSSRKKECRIKCSLQQLRASSVQVARGGSVAKSASNTAGGGAQGVICGHLAETVDKTTTIKNTPAKGLNRPWQI